MSKHTPGPWISMKDGLGPMSVYAPDNKGIWHKDRSKEETEANAQLIAAAPDMLAALKLAREALFDTQYYAMADMNVIDAAICKALGE